MKMLRIWLNWLLQRKLLEIDEIEKAEKLSDKIKGGIYKDAALYYIKSYKNDEIDSE